MCHTLGNVRQHAIRKREVLTIVVVEVLAAAAAAIVVIKVLAQLAACGDVIKLLSKVHLHAS